MITFTRINQKKRDEAEIMNKNVIIGVEACVQSNSGIPLVEYCA